MSDVPTLTPPPVPTRPAGFVGHTDAYTREAITWCADGTVLRYWTRSLLTLTASAPETRDQVTVYQINGQPVTREQYEHRRDHGD